MATVDIQSTPPAIVEITGNDGATIMVPVPAAVQVSVETSGTQGPDGLTLTAGDGLHIVGIEIRQNIAALPPAP